MIVCLNGTFIDDKKATVSVLDHGFLYADGFYDTMRIYQGMIFELPLHLARIERSAKAMDIGLPKTKQIASWLEKIVSVNKLLEARVRITVTRGTRGRDFSKSIQPTMVITCEHVKVMPPQGESACTMRMVRTLPDIKTIGGLSTLFLAKKEAGRRGVDQIIGFDEQGCVRAAATSNVFVVKNGRLLTPKNGILKGLTRKRAIALARALGISVTVRDFKIGVLTSADEIFLTNRVRELWPIVGLNGKKIGSGKVGSVTRKLMEAYTKYVRLTRLAINEAPQR